MDFDLVNHINESFNSDVIIKILLNLSNRNYYISKYSIFELVNNIKEDSLFNEFNGSGKRKWNEDLDFGQIELLKNEIELLNIYNNNNNCSNNQINNQNNNNNNITIDQLNNMKNIKKELIDQFIIIIENNIKIKKLNNNSNSRNNNSINSDSGIGSGIDSSNKESILFFKIYRNIFIKKIIFYHLKLFNLNHHKRIFNSIQELVHYKYKNYLYSIQLNCVEEIDTLDKVVPDNVKTLFHFYQPKKNFFPDGLLHIYCLGDHGFSIEKDCFSNCKELKTVSFGNSGINSIVNIGTNSNNRNNNKEKINNSIILSDNSLPNSVCSLSILCGNNSSISFQKVFNPINLTNLELGPNYTHNISKQSLSALKSLKTLILSKSSTQSFSEKELPQSITKLRYSSGELKKSSLEKNNNLVYLEFPNSFNHKIIEKSLPTSLRTIVFGKRYTKKIKPRSIPNGVTAVSFNGLLFNNRLPIGAIPNSCKKLKLSLNFAENVHYSNLNSYLNLPLSLCKLSIGTIAFELICNYNSNNKHQNILPNTLNSLHLIDIKEIIPTMKQLLCTNKTITSLKLGYYFNSTINSSYFPPSLKKLKLLAFNQRITSQTFPEKLEYLQLGFEFNKPISPLTLPNSLKIFRLGRGFQSHKLVKHSLPDSITILDIELNNQTISSEWLPSSLKYLITWGSSSIKEDNLPISLEFIYTHSTNKQLLDNLNLSKFINNLRVLDTGQLYYLLIKKLLNNKSNQTKPNQIKSKNERMNE